MGRPAHWLHDRPHFFKYLTPSAGLAVLETSSLRWSAPSLFNDPFDLGFDLHQDYDPQSIEQNVIDAWWSGYQGDSSFVAKGNLGAALTAFAKLKPGLARPDFDRHALPGIRESLKVQEQLLPYLHSKMGEILAGTRVLCVSEIKDNILMWSHYCENHSGMVLQLNCIEAVDSIWGAAQPVKYVEEMPRFLSHDQQVLYLSGQLELQETLNLETLIFSKASDWAYEREWRMAQPLQISQTAFQDVSFQTVELGSVIFGCRIDPVVKAAAVKLVAEKYPHVKMWQAQKSRREFKLEFEAL